MINLKASRKTPSITVGCNPVTNVHIDSGKVEPSVRYPAVDQGVAGPRITYPNTGEFVSVAPQAPVSSFTASTVPLSDDPAASQMRAADSEKAALMRENAVLKLIIDIQHNNPLIVKNYIIADDQTLMKMVALLCNASEVHIDADDIGCGCVTKNTYRKVHSIYVIVDGQTLNLKYHFSDVMKTLKDLHISVKYVF